VEVRPIKVSRQIDREVVVASGVKAGDHVITEVPQALQTGAAVRLADSAGTGEKGKKGKKGKKKGEGKKEAGANTEESSKGEQAKAAEK
jgi:hypothetical protein